MSSQPPFNLQQLLNSGSNAYVASLYGRGMLYNEVFAKLKDRFPTAQGQSLRGAVLRGEQSYRAAQALNGLPDEQRLLASQVPGGTGTGPGYRYTAVLTIRDPASGVKRERVLQATMPGSATHGQIEAALEEAARARYLPGGNRNPDSDVQPNFEVTYTEVYSVERT